MLKVHKAPLALGAGSTQVKSNEGGSCSKQPKGIVGAATKQAGRSGQKRWAEEVTMRGARRAWQQASKAGCSCRAAHRDDVPGVMKES